MAVRLETVEAQEDCIGAESEGGRGSVRAARGAQRGSEKRGGVLAMEDAPRLQYGRHALAAAASSFPGSTALC